MRLAFLAPEFLPTWGGVGIYSFELVKGLCKYKDLEIHVITPKRGENYDSSKISEFFGDKIIIHNISKANDDFFYNLSFQLKLLERFSGLNKKYKFDLVHAANLVHMPDIYLKFIKLDIPSVTTIHTTLKSQTHFDGKTRLNKEYAEDTKVERLTSLFYPYIRFLERVYLKKTENFIAVSNWIKSFIEEENKNIEVIHNGIDLNRFSPRNKPEGFRSLDDIDKPLVLYSGRLLALKGIKVLINSIKTILKKEDVYFVFAGSGDVKRWERLLKINNISNKNYKFLGYVDYEKMHNLYLRSDIFVLPSFTESFPLTILEAMSCKIPVIASNVGGVSEIIESSKDGMLVRPGDSKQLMNNILEILNNDRLRNKITTNGRKKIEKNFDSRIMAEKTKRFYERVLEVN